MLANNKSLAINNDYIGFHIRKFDINLISMVEQTGLSPAW